MAKDTTKQRRTALYNGSPWCREVFDRYGKSVDAIHAEGLAALHVFTIAQLVEWGEMEPIPASGRVSTLTLVEALGY